MRSPTVSGQLVHEQLELAHRYRNTLIEIERRKRQRYRDLRQSIEASLPSFGRWQALYDDLNEQMQVATEAVQAYKVEHRTKRAPQGLTSRVRELKSLRTRASRGVSFSRKRLNRRIDPTDLDEQAAAEIRAARAQSGLYWGTYLLVEDAMKGTRKKKGSDPEFRRRLTLGHHAQIPADQPELGYYEGRVGVQVQGQVPLSSIINGSDTRLQIHLHPYHLPEEHRLPRHERQNQQRPQKQYATVKIRVGSDGIAPIWAEFPAMIHRKLPSDALVKWAWIKVRRIGTTIRYDLQLTLEAASFQRPKGQGVVAVDLNWRQLDDGSIRVGYGLDDQGREFIQRMPAQARGQVLRAESLAGIRDTAFNEHKARLLEWVGAQNDLPEWFRERIECLAQWRSKNRLAHLVSDWRTARFEGDEDIYGLLEAWRRQDRHLFQWEANARAKAVRSRNGAYRCFAAQLKGYAQLIIEDFDLREVAKRVEPEVGEELPQAARHNRFLSAPSQLRGCLKEAVGKDNVIEVPAEYTTMRHFECGHVEDRGTAIMHTCSHCGATFDQDLNAARNILDAYFRGPEGQNIERSSAAENRGGSRSRSNTAVDSPSGMAAE